MRLSHIKIAGFKTYADPVTLELPNNNTALVGPNGCGKSNLIEAIRFVIGESQASQLRGESLDGLIFHGTAKRAPAGQATIELVFDNEDRRVQGAYADYSEISIKRVITRDSGSKFYLNGKKCRQKDIKDVMLSAGFSSRGYAVIPQGMIKDLINSKPEDLRVHVEDAAGISRYRNRRRETEQKIHATVENLARSKDHGAELERHLKHLRRQSREALKYSHFKQTEREIAAKLLAIQIRSRTEELHQHQTNLDLQNLEVEKLQGELQSVLTKIDTTRVREMEMSAQFSEVQEQSFTARAELARLDETIKHINDTLSERDRRIVQLTKNIAESQEESHQVSITLDKIKSSAHELRQQHEGAQQRLTESQGQHAEAREKLSSWQQSLDVFNRKFTELESTLNIALTQRDNFSHELIELQQKANSLEKRANEMSPDVDFTPLESNIKELERRLDDGNTTSQSYDQKIDHMDMEDSKDNELRRQYEVTIGNLREERSALTAVVEQVIGADHLEDLNDHPLNAVVQRYGRIGEQLEVNPGWEFAIETLMQTSIKGIAVPDLDEVMSQLNDDRSVEVLISEPGTTNKTNLEPVHTVIRHGADYVAALHPHVYLVETLTDALARRSELKIDGSMITRGGVQVGKHWIKFPGTKEKETTIFESRGKLAELNTDLNQAERRYERLLEQISGRANHRSELRELNRKQQQDNRELSTILEEKRIEFERVHHTAAEKQRNHERTQLEYDEVLLRISQCQAQLTELTSTIEDTQRTKNRLNDKRSDLLEEQQSLVQRFDSSLDEERRSTQAFHQVELELKSAVMQTEALTTSLHRLQREAVSQNEQIDQIQEDRAIDENKLPALQQQRTTVLDRVDRIDKELRDARTARDQLVEALREYSTEESRHRIAIEDAQEKLASVRERHVEISTYREHLLSEFDQGGYTYDQATALLNDDDLPEKLEAKRDRIRTRLEKLGAVNLAAEKDLQVLAEEYETVSARISDLETSQTTLEHAIAKIDSEAQIAFDETLQRASEHFQRLFTMLFEGGSAELKLAEGDPLFAGVSAVVQLPGKRIQHIDSLSGGERALAAIAFVFSMFQLNPSPVCILDEVDANLDETHNIYQFTNMIHEYAKSMQFLIVTHKRVTMHSAGSLIGVTMEEAGVSRFVSVELE